MSRQLSDTPPRKKFGYFYAPCAANLCDTLEAEAKSRSKPERFGKLLIVISARDQCVTSQLIRVKSMESTCEAGATSCHCLRVQNSTAPAHQLCPSPPFAFLAKEDRQELGWLERSVCYLK